MMFHLRCWSISPSNQLNSPISRTVCKCNQLEGNYQYFSNFTSTIPFTQRVWLDLGTGDLVEEVDGGRWQIVTDNVDTVGWESPPTKLERYSSDLSPLSGERWGVGFHVEVMGNIFTVNMINFIILSSSLRSRGKQYTDLLFIVSWISRIKTILTPPVRNRFVKPYFKFH